jgi:hypothetical protein
MSITRRTNFSVDASAALITSCINGLKKDLEASQGAPSLKTLISAVGVAHILRFQL